jgi:hypothetical protein
MRMKYVLIFFCIGWYGVGWNMVSLPDPASHLKWIRLSQRTTFLGALTRRLPAFSVLLPLSFLTFARPSHRYLWVYLVVLKSFLVYVSDIFSATTMLTTDNWSNEIFKQCQSQDGCFFIPFSVGKWLFVGCIIFSFLLVCC